MTNKVKRVFVGITVIGMAFSLLPISAVFSTASATGSCTLASTSGRTLIYFNEHIRADWSQADATAGPLGTFIPAGIYRVTLVSFDNHWAKSGQTDQTQERWFVGLQNSGGSTFANTPSINDLPDNINTLTQVVVSEFTVLQNTSAVFARHSAFPGSNANSITAVCAAFDFVRDIDNDNSDEPDVVTDSPTNIDEDGATLRGQTRPNGDDTDAWFEWGTSPSNLSNITLVQDVGSGVSFVGYSVTISGLDENTTYYYRAVAQNSDGTDFGGIVSLTTDDIDTNDEAEPDVTTLSARNVEDDEARLRGQVRPNDLYTDVWFEWGDSRFNLDEDTSREIIDRDTSSASFDFVIDNLDDDTLYYFRAVAENDEGIDRGSVFSFRTDDNGSGDDEPDIRDVDVENIDDDSARLVCTVDANGNTTSVWFEWDEDEDDVDDGDGEKTRRVSVSRSNTRRDVKITITGLDDDTRYFFRCVAKNSEGTDRSRVEDFRTDDDGRSSRDEPDVTTRSATDIGQSSVLLRGEADPNGEDTDVWFQWGTSRSNLNSSSRAEDIGDGTREKDFDKRITGLRPNTLYYFRAVAQNREGIDRGGTLSFRTDRGVAAPVTTVRAPITTPITRIVEVFRDRFFSPREEGLIITLNTDTRRIDRGIIEYEISYDNRTDDTFTSTVLTLVIPDELEFVDASPREDEVRGDTISFEIGTIRPGDDESFVIETEIGRRVDEKDDIIFSASISYIDDDDKKIVTVVDITRIADARGGDFTAFFAGSLAEFFTNPFLWLIILLVVIFFVYRYFASLAKPKDEVEFLDNVLQPPLPQDNEL